MIVTIDNREKSRICPAVQYYMAKYKVVIEKLPCGDFLFTDHNTKVVFEYKTMIDFMWSINDGRVFDQIVKQAKQFDYHFLIVEWNEADKNKAKKQIGRVGKNLHDTQIHEVIARLNTVTTVIISPDKNFAFSLMENHAKICLEENPFSKKPLKKSDNIVYDYLMLIPGINSVKAHTICKRLNLKTIEDLTGVTAKKLVKVPGIGPVTAQKIVSCINGN